MIRIERAPEPASLPPIRAAELARVRPSIVKHELWEQQKMKCCYCEAHSECVYHDVEHFRPKARANRMNGTVSPGYWWLAWTWENLLFSCQSCNRSAKKDLFPLETGSVPLTPENPPPDGRHWRPRGRNGSMRGQRTIELLELDRADLLTRYNAYVSDYVKPLIDATHEAIGLGNESLVRSAWRRVRALLSPRKEFAALSYDAIDHFVPAALRAQWGLELPRPPVRRP